MRVVSVLPSATEIVCALGHGSELAGRSAECDFPEEVRRLPVAMRARTLDSERPSRAIDERVRDARARGESLYVLDTGLLRELQPDVLLTQNLCGVCSVTEEEVQEACRHAGVQPRVVSLAPTNLEEVWGTFGTVAQALNDPGSGRMLTRTVTSKAAPQRSTGRTVAVVEWLDPPIVAGLWTPDIITTAGGVPAGAHSSQPGVRTTWTDLARKPPDLLVLSPCSFTVEHSARELAANATLRAAVGSVDAPLGTFLADEAYFSRPGPRLADGVVLIRSLLDGITPNGPMPVSPFQQPVGPNARP